MVWNTIAHPKMMCPDESVLGESTPVTLTMTPIKFANTHKLSFYDVIVSISRVTIDPSSGGADRAYTLVKGDFETLKNMILNDEAVCGAIFGSVRDGSVTEQSHIDFATAKYIADANVIGFVPANSDANATIYLHSDNTITDGLTSESGLPDGTQIDDGSGQSELMS